jgi:hypothetical protein
MGKNSGATEVLDLWALPTPSACTLLLYLHVRTSNGHELIRVEMNLRRIRVEN